MIHLSWVTTFDNPLKQCSSGCWPMQVLYLLWNMEGPTVEKAQKRVTVTAKRSRSDKLGRMVSWYGSRICIQMYSINVPHGEYQSPCCTGYAQNNPNNDLLKCIEM